MQTDHGGRRFSLLAPMMTKIIRRHWNVHAKLLRGVLERPSHGCALDGPHIPRHRISHMNLTKVYLLDRYIEQMPDFATASAKHLRQCGAGAVSR